MFVSPVDEGGVKPPRTKALTGQRTPKGGPVARASALLYNPPFAKEVK